MNRRLHYYSKDVRIQSFDPVGHQARHSQMLYDDTVKKAVADGCIPIYEDYICGEFEVIGRRIGIRLGCIFVGKRKARNWLECSVLRRSRRWNSIITIPEE